MTNQAPIVEDGEMSERSERIIRQVAAARSAELLIRTPPQAVPG